MRSLQLHSRPEPQEVPAFRTRRRVDQQHRPALDDRQQRPVRTQRHGAGVDPYHLAALLPGERWFTDLAGRSLYPPEDHPFLSRMYVAGLRRVVTLRGPGSEAAQLAGLLLAESAEFRDLRGDLEIGVRPDETKRFVHPEAGLLELNCQILVDRGSPTR